MKRLEISLNILHYAIYRAHYNLHLFANKINPFNFIHNLPFQKRRYQELGIDIHKEINKAFEDKENGLSVIVAGGVLLGTIFFFVFSIANILLDVISNDGMLSTIHFIAFGLFSSIVCYLSVFKNDKYLIYFKQFDSWTKDERKKYDRISFSFILVIFLMFFASLIWL